MPATMPLLPASTTHQEVEEWFGELFHDLKTHQLMLTTGTAPADMQAFYQTLMQKDLVGAATQAKNAYNRSLTSVAVVGFMQAVTRGQAKPRQLAFSVADSALLVWAVVSDDDEAAERAVYLAEAEMNANLRTTGFRVKATVVETSDRFAIPAHYQIISFEEQAER